MLREGIYKKEYIEEGEEDKRESTRTLSPRMIDSSPSFSPLTLSLFRIQYQIASFEIWRTLGIDARRG